MRILDVKNVRKVYGGTGGRISVEALTNVNFSVEKGEFIAIMGESGSGKTTLLNIVATLDKATDGKILIAEKEIGKLSDSQVASFRRNELGFVFQDFNLLDSFTNRDNIYLPLVLSGMEHREMAKRILPISRNLRIEDILNKYPYEISGGQKQRIAIARALITNPGLILADEPTGALDSSASENIMKIFSEINKAGQTILMVTHSLKSASHAGRVLFIKDGMVYHEIFKGADSHQEFMERISAAQSMLNRKEL